MNRRKRWPWNRQNFFFFFCTLFWKEVTSCMSRFARNCENCEFCETSQKSRKTESYCGVTFEWIFKSADYIASGSFLPWITIVFCNLYYPWKVTKSKEGSEVIWYCLFKLVVCRQLLTVNESSWFVHTKVMNLLNPFCLVTGTRRKLILDSSIVVR